jgi:hypothetical protein
MSREGRARSPLRASNVDRYSLPGTHGVRVLPNMLLNPVDGRSWFLPLSAEVVAAGKLPWIYLS